MSEAGNVYAVKEARTRIREALAILDGAPTVTIFSRVQVGRVRDSLRHSLKEVDETLRVLKGDR